MIPAGFRSRSIALVFCFTALAYVPAFGGGPLTVGGPAVGSRAAFGVSGKPFTWDPAKMPITYRVDPGPMSTSGSSQIISNAAGLQRVQSMFGVWQSVPTAAISYSYAGTVLPAGSYAGGDVSTVAQYNDIIGSCQSGTQSPVIFDADGSLLSDLGFSSSVIGFTTICALDTKSGHITAAALVMNGTFQDGINNPFELTDDQFDQAITHEIGHFSGLDHSQINLDLLTQSSGSSCDTDGLAGLPLMFPIAICQPRKSLGLPVLAPDDVAWISSLYPSASYTSSYGTISGRIFFSDGTSQAQGVNVIARQVDDPSTPEDESRRFAVSSVSGYLFTSNPGQSFTASMPDPAENNTNGAPAGSRDPELIGYYEMPVPPGIYTVEVESIDSDFDGGSSVGPLSPPVPISGPHEFWNKDESSFDLPLQRDTITVHAGDHITNTDVVLDGQQTRFDVLEDSGALLDSPLSSPMEANLECES